MHLKAIPERLLKDGRKTEVLFPTGLVGRSPGLQTYHRIIPILALNMKLDLLPSSFLFSFLHLT